MDSLLGLDHLENKAKKIIPSKLDFTTYCRRQDKSRETWKPTSNKDSVNTLTS